MSQYISAGVAILWPMFIGVMIWFVGGLVALFYARATRRPLFLFSALVAFLMMIERLLSPVRVGLHYLQQKTIYTGDFGTLDLVAGGYKFEWLIDALAAALLLIGLILEVRRARQRAVLAQAARAAGAASAAAPVAAAVPAGAHAQPSTSYAQPPAGYAQPSSGQIRASRSFDATSYGASDAERRPSQAFPTEEPPGSGY